MGFIRTSRDRLGFEDDSTGKPFVPVGSNYCGVMAALSSGGYCGSGFPTWGHDEWTAKDGIAECERAFARMGALDLNVVRMWLEPDDMFRHGLRLHPDGVRKFEGMLDSAGKHGLRLAVGMHLAPTPSGWKLHNFQPPHHARLLDMLFLFGQRWGQDERIFSWTLVGEGNLPWQTDWMVAQWPAFLQYWYNDDLEALKKAWGHVGITIRSFAEAPVPPRNVGYLLGCGAVNPGNLDKLPHDPWANSTWRYDWRMFMDEIGSARVHAEVRALRAAGARQMTTVGNNSWIFPNLPCSQMAAGYNPYFYLDSVDYTCQHHYPAPQCMPGGNGDPMSSEKAMQSWLNAVEVMGRVYTSLGKPVMLEEWSWYGGGETAFLCKLPFRSEAEQREYGERMMEVTQRTYSGWMHWMWRDQPKASDLTNFSGLYAADGKRLKPWGKAYAAWARKLQTKPPKVAKARKTVEMPMKALYTCDRTHETWLQAQMRNIHRDGPYDFTPLFEQKPMTDVITDLTSFTAKRTGAVETPMGTAQR